MSPAQNASRRMFLQHSFNGIGALGLGSLMAMEPAAQQPERGSSTVKTAHFPNRAKRCIFLFMQGGVSQVDSFDYKPTLEKFHGKRMPKMPGLTGELEGRLRFQHACVKSPFGFKKYGQSGRYLSEIGRASVGKECL